MPAQPPVLVVPGQPVPLAPGAVQLGVDDLSANDLIEIINSGPRIAVASLETLRQYFIAAFGTITSKTEDYQLLVTDSFGDFDNRGAVNPVTFSLPPVADSRPGLQYTIAVVAGQPVTLSADAGVTVSVGSIATSSGGEVASSNPGDTITVKCRTTTLWSVEAITGTWEVS